MSICLLKRRHKWWKRRLLQTCQVVEHVDELFPELDVVSTLALVQEPVDFSDILVFVVASQQMNSVGVLNLVSHQQTNTLNTLFSPIHIITKKQVVAVGREPCIVEKPEQVIVLPMYV